MPVYGIGVWVPAAAHAGSVELLTVGPCARTIPTQRFSTPKEENNLPYRTTVKLGAFANISLPVAPQAVCVLLAAVAPPITGKLTGQPVHEIIREPKP